MNAPDAAQEALQALERLVTRHKLLTMDEGKTVAKLITGNADVEFPPPRPPPAPPAPPTAAPRTPPPAPPASTEAPAPTDNASAGESEPS